MSGRDAPVYTTSESMSYFTRTGRSGENVERARGKQQLVIVDKKKKIAKGAGEWKMGNVCQVLT